MSALNIRNVRKVFGAVTVLDDIDLEAESGEFIILVGASGCGKSTLLNMIAGLDMPTSGTIHIAGRDVTRLPSKDRDIAMVFQSYALYPTMSVAGNIAFGLEMRKVPKAERDAAVARVARMLQIEHLLKTTTVYVTHDQVEAMTLGDRIAVMRAGHVEQFGTPQQIYEAPATRFVAEFIGSPSMNFLPVEHRDGALLCAHIVLSTTEAQRAALQTGGSGASTRLLYGVRPEALSLSSHGVPGSVKMVEPTGPDTYMLIDTELGTLTARLPGTRMHRAGEHVLVSWPSSQVHLFDAATERRVA
jgi:multiple sugar transport system ATP-binding protein